MSDKASTRGETTTDCRSEEGITVGLVDAIISISRVLAKRDLSPHAVQEALKDLAADEDARKIFGHERDERRQLLLSGTPCEHEGCTELVAINPEHQCIACKGHYCHTHLKNSTWYGGNPENLCFDCSGDQAEPVQY